jgi:sugar O-acyltransferase (sialic acid O-acetyltransferase NeuD family)
MTTGNDPPAPRQAERSPGSASAGRPLVILGTGGNALDVLDVVTAINERAPLWDLIGVLDDATAIGSNALGLWTFGELSDAGALSAHGGPLADALFVNAIGSSRSHVRRAEIVQSTGLPIERFATLVHPGASVSVRAEMGRGCCISFGACIAGRVRMHDHVWIGPGCVIGHDSVLEDNAIMAPRATLSGSVRLGAGCYVGSCAVIREGLTVGAGALVGMGAVVLRDLMNASVVAGNPARDLQPPKGGPPAR